MASQFLAAIAEETTKKAYTVYESLASLPKLFIEDYPGQTVTSSFLNLQDKQNIQTFYDSFNI